MTESMPYLFVVCGIVVCGWLMTRLVQKLRFTPIGEQADEANVQQTIDSVRSGLMELRDWLARSEEGDVEIARPNHREQVSRLRRRGRSAPEIAATLGITGPEVHFLMKVQAAVDGLDEVGAEDSPSFRVPAEARGVSEVVGMTTQLAVQQSC
ncbi:MAG: hypothetical protein NTY38_01735 [Acidobacteria bacterium]|nr:hypothetical protein [Acidobacteriota bacterium]